MIGQSITTHYIGPTNARPARVVAESAAGHRLVSVWNHALNLERNHARAAQKLAVKLAWDGAWLQGSTRNGYAFVLAGSDSFATWDAPEHA